MPTSDHRQISTALDVVLKREPRSILDIGVGYGKYGTLLREYLPDARIVGVEPYGAYAEDDRGMERWSAYDLVAEHEWPSPSVDALLGSFMPQADVCLMIDVIEHYPRPKRFEALSAALSVSPCLVVATPHDPMQWPQDELENPLERHYDAFTLAALQGALQRMSRPAWIAEGHWLADSYIVVIERV